MSALKLKITLFFSAALLLTPSFLTAAETGTIGGQVLKLGAHSRGIGQGEAFAAVSDDVSALYFNPAGLAQLTRPQAAVTHMNRIAGIRSVDMGFAFPLEGEAGVLGAAAYYLYTHDRERDTDGNEIGRFRSYNSYIILGYARKITPELYAGVNAKFLLNKIYDYRTSNAGFDAGLLYSHPGGLRAGLNIQNIDAGVKLRSDDSLESWPLNIKAGVSYTFSGPGLTLAADMNKPEDTDMNFSAGAEYILLDSDIFFALRTGYKYRDENSTLGGLAGLAGGFGAGYDRYRLDYAYTPWGDLGNTLHRISLLTEF